MSTSLHFYFSIEIRFIISLLFYIMARFLAIVWKPRKEYSTLLILVRELPFFLPKFLAKLDSKCVWGSLEKCMTMEL